MANDLMAYNVNRALRLQELRASLEPVSFVSNWVIRPVAVVACGVHGYKRNHGSLGAGIGWAFLGAIAPILTTSIAVAMGFGEPERRTAASRA
jgi:hypothetical protein